MNSRNAPRALFVTTAVCAIAAIAAAPAGAAGKTQFRFFSNNTSQVVTDATGKPLSREPAAGDRFTTTDVNYAGNHRHHARRYTSTDHLACTLTGPMTAICDGQLTIGASMLLVENATIDFSQPHATFPITGGTGRFHGAKGTIVSTNVGRGDDSDDVISLR